MAGKAPKQPNPLNGETIQLEIANSDFSRRVKAVAFLEIVNGGRDIFATITTESASGAINGPLRVVLYRHLIDFADDRYAFKYQYLGPSRHAIVLPDSAWT